MSEQVPPPPPGSRPDPGAAPSSPSDRASASEPSSGPQPPPDSGSGSHHSGWLMAGVALCVVLLGVLVAGVLTRDDSGKSANPPVSVGVTQTTVQGRTVTQTTPDVTVDGQVTVTGSTPPAKTTTTTKTTPSPTTSTGSSRTTTSTTTSSP
jgi:hypothetical protein